MAVEEREVPRIEQPGDAIVRVTTAAICGSDLLPYRGRTQRTPGSTIGHEFVGVVEEVGPGVSAPARGSRVVSPFSVWCGGCFYCKQGLLSACENTAVFGVGLPGAQAEYVRVPNAAAVLEALPEAIADETAVLLAHPLSGIYAALQLAGLKAGESVVVLGCGTAGLVAQMLARTMGAAQVFAVDHHADRLALAQRLGSAPLSFETDDVAARVREATGGRGADLTIEAAGTAAAIASGVELTRPWGTLLSISLGVEAEAAFPIGRLTARRVRLLPAYSPAVKNYIGPVLRLLSHGGLDPSPIVSHVLPLSEAPRGYELLANRAEGAIKVLLRP